MPMAATAEMMMVLFMSTAPFRRDKVGVKENHSLVVTVATRLWMIVVTRAWGRLHPDERRG